MTISDVVSLICAIVTLIATIVIGIFQIRQNKNMNDFEQRQDERDEKRHFEEVNAKAVSFISKYYEVRGLIPLCAIAAMYNELYYYRSEMYREFCCFTTEIQNRILEYCDLDLRITEFKPYEFYITCLDALESIIKDSFPLETKNLFYDGGKYLMRSLHQYGRSTLPVREYSFNNDIADIICTGSEDTTAEAKPISQIASKFVFDKSPEITACQLATTIAIYVSMYNGNRNNDGKNYGSPGEYDGETIDYMEDLFLKALFEIYTNLVL